jgi:ribonuclease R
MSKELENQILQHVRSTEYRPTKARGLARDLSLNQDETYPAFRDALRELMRAGHVILGASNTVMLPTQRVNKDEFLGTYRHNKRGFGFVVPTDPGAREDLFIPPGGNGGALNGDIVRAKITERGHREGKAITSGRVTEVVERKNKRFVGSLVKLRGEWFVTPDGNALTENIRTPDAASRHVRPGTKVVVELTAYPADGQPPEGVITEILGQAGEKDVDLRSIIIQHNLPGDFPDAVKDQARVAVDQFNPALEAPHRLDLSDEIICTIDPDDAKDYDDAISLKQVEGGYWELGVHIADVSHFVKAGTPLDEEARERGNSSYFPGHVIPMLPEILSNGVCSLQEKVPRLCKSAFITLDDDARPLRTRFGNTIIHSRQRLRYREAQAIIDGQTEIPHPNGNRTLAEYPPEVLELLHNMNTVARRIQKRRLHDGQLVLDLPEVELVLDEDGKIIDAVPEDTSFTHTLIEMFMVEANEAVARLLHSLQVPFLRRAHPDPEAADNERLRHFAQVTGHKIPKEMDRKALQQLLVAAKDKPEGFAINLAVLRSLTRAEYSPETIGHYALASEHYAHFTSPIRRYADLTIHRLLDAYFDAGGGQRSRGVKIDPSKVPSYNDLVELGRHISFTERRSEDAERELRRVKILELMKNHIGDEFIGVVTGITNFGVFIQLKAYLVDGLIRYEDLMDDWWDVDERSGVVRGQRTGTRIGIGDVVTARVVKVDLPRRELDLSIIKIISRSGHCNQPANTDAKKSKHQLKKQKNSPRKGKHPLTGGSSRRSRPPKRRGR